MIDMGPGTRPCAMYYDVSSSGTICGYIKTNSPINISFVSTCNSSNASVIFVPLVQLALQLK